jgi:hypothetical protein
MQSAENNSAIAGSSQSCKLSRNKRFYRPPLFGVPDAARGDWCGMSSVKHDAATIYPPASAPITRNGSFASAIAAGSGASGDSSERSSWHAKNRRNGRRSSVT